MYSQEGLTLPPKMTALTITLALGIIYVTLKHMVAFQDVNYAMNEIVLKYAVTMNHYTVNC